MSAKKAIQNIPVCECCRTCRYPHAGITAFALAIFLYLLPAISFSSTSNSLAYDSIAQQLGWVQSNENQCGGYYLEPPFFYAATEHGDAIQITAREGVYTQRGTSILENEVTLSRKNQQMIGDKAFLYRDPTTGKLQAVDFIGHVQLREPNTLILGEKGHYDVDTKSKCLVDVLYRTTLRGMRRLAGPSIPNECLLEERKINTLSAWGTASEISSTEPRVYQFDQCSFSTCPPIDPAWQIRASHIELNKNTGRGYATHARFYAKNIPIFYMPYINFSIDKQRKSGFLWPTIGLSSSKWGPYFLTPFYWNMAPNYDMTITPGLLTKRGMQLSDTFRYLTSTSLGKIYLSVLPNDRAFTDFQEDVEENPLSANPPKNQFPSITQAETNRLLKSSTTRTGFYWHDKSRFNEHWSSYVDINYVSDDYYLRDFGHNVNKITENQLLQQADLYYSGPNWNFTARLQSYQTLHPVDENLVNNQYRRLPQLILNADYPDQAFGLEYFMNNELTHFDILNDPGVTLAKPIGTRFHLQPGVSWPCYTPSFYINPRLQVALTQYDLHQTEDTHTPRNIHRALPIFDLISGISLTRDITLFDTLFHQTLEPQLYYTYIPFHNQRKIPIFDTTVNTLTYEQIFNYNRFTGLDRIGDANQLSIGVTSRLIDQDLGIERVRMGLGGIIYFANRRVTLCNDKTCTDNPRNPNNHRTFSPLSALFNYAINPQWTFTSNLIWNLYHKHVDNTTLSLHYQPAPQRIINISYSFARNYDILSGIVVNTSRNNVNVTDISFAWPFIFGISAMGRWTQDWKANHFQNIFYGVQYDTCCWAVRLVGGKSFTNLTNNNKPHYHNQFYVQFDLKGLGNVGSDPSKLLSGISGYNTQFGQDI